MTAVTAPPTTRVGHVIATLPLGIELRELACRALDFGRLGAHKMTILLVSEHDLELTDLDSACRRLATLVRERTDEGCAVRLVVRHGPVDQALSDLMIRESTDLVLVPDTIELLDPDAVPCPVVPLEP
ncbi:MAG: hypothetical protein CMJ83_13085 [Planctomycetes bacterium]|nr:hypothetical protein [Planctomycetota bacterium]